jgi:hypothetical protein
MPDDFPNEIIQNVIRETMPRTLQIKVTSSQFDGRTAKPNGSPIAVIEEIYFETDKGERYFDERASVPSQPVSHKSSYCDGKRTVHIRFSPGDSGSQQTASIGHDFKTESRFGFRDAPAPIRYYHVGLVPLHDALANAERLSDDLVIGRACGSFHFRDVGPVGKQQSLVYSLDHETSVPLRVAAFRGPEQLKNRVPNWVWEAKTLDVVSGRHIARSSTYSSFGVRKTEAGHWVSDLTMCRLIEVNEVTFDKPIEHAAFWPIFEPGVQVMDSIAKRRTEVPGKAPATPESARTGVPIRVISDGGSWLPAIGVALSLAAFTVAIVLWRRSR